jgi:hypothetical protein
MTVVLFRLSFMKSLFSFCQTLVLIVPAGAPLGVFLLYVGDGKIRYIMLSYLDGKI